MDDLYDVVFRMVERRYDTKTRELFASWLRTARPTLAHLAVMMTEIGLSGRGTGNGRLTLFGFTPDGEPLVGPDHPHYDLNFRPASYWGTLDDNAPDRRVRRADGQFSAVRRRPVFDLGREFLPHPQPSEVEIAFISLASVTGDLISIGAQRSGKQIVYRIVDEYGTNFRFHPTQSVQPLSLGELISMIDYATGHLDGARGLTNAYRDHNLDGCDAEDLVDFVTVSSDFYPALRAYYEDQARAWLARRAAKRRERNEPS